MKRLLDSLAFASLRHREQRRKGERGAPYINHLIEVAQVLSMHGVADEEVLCAAVLHDTVEDAEVSLADLRQRFGNRIASLVEEVTDDPRLPIWERKMRQVEGAGKLSSDAQCIRVADKISNLRGILTSPPPLWSWERKKAYYRWAKQVVAGCALAPAPLRRTFDDVYAAGLMALEVMRDSRGSAPRDEGSTSSRRPDVGNALTPCVEVTTPGAPGPLDS